MTTQLQFARFRLDRANQSLEDGSGPIPLNPKAFAVLCELVEHPGQLVSKEQLLEEVWKGTHVSDGVVKVCINELRSALGDSATQPNFIQTVHRRGYRFVANVRTAPSSELALPRSGSLVAWPPTHPSRSAAALVGRGAELEQLERRLARALDGERQAVFLTGDPGLGKTALAERFVLGAARRATLAVTGGQCLEQFGSAEAYMPVFEAIGRLARENAAVRRLLRRCAPTWFAQLPWLLDDGDSEQLEREMLGAARDRLLREMAEFVEMLTAEIPLVLVLEDLHWSDPSTVDLLSLLLARREPARLLVIGSYRPGELAFGRHPLRTLVQTLRASARCGEIALGRLDEEAIAEYLASRFPDIRFGRDVAPLLRERSDGNPLFLATLADHLVARGAIRERDGRWEADATLVEELNTVPESLRLVIEQQLGRLPAEGRALLEAASLVGIDFSAAAAAAAADRPLVEVEEQCSALVGAGPFLSAAGTGVWPDGTIAERFAFRHALYREALASQISGARRSAAHLRIGRALEAAYQDRSSEIAAEIAFHLEEGGDRGRAVRHRRSAAETAARRFSFVEAETHLGRALALLGELPASPEHDRDEFALQSMIGTVRQATRGYAAPEVTRAFARALELAPGASEPSAFPVHCAIWTFYTVTGDLDRALALAEQNREIAEASGDRLMRLIAHQGLWTTHFFRGEFTAALHHLDAGQPLYDPAAHRHAALHYGTDPGSGALSYRALALAALGEVDPALELAHQAVAEARALGHPLSLGRALVFAAFIRECRGEVEACRDEADAMLAYCREQQLPYWMPHGLGMRGWALVQTGELERGIADLEQGLALWKASGATCGSTPNNVELASAYVRVGRLGDARGLIAHAKALADRGERFYEPEIDRVEAELALAEDGGAGAPLEAPIGHT